MKSKPTPKQTTALRRMRQHGEALREWLRREKPEQTTESQVRGGYGKTRVMRNIKPKPPEYVHRHAHPGGWDRRHKRSETGAVIHRAVPLFAGNTPYVNPERDVQRVLSKKGSRLRAERENAVILGVLTKIAEDNQL